MVASPARRTLVPQALREGDRVAVLSPAGPLHEPRRGDLDRGLAELRARGLRPMLGAHALDVQGYLAGADRDRLADLQQAFADPTIRGIFCVRGGYGVTRILPALDFEPLRADPKPIIGYSDVTALLAAAWHEIGLVGFHGPMVATTRALDSGTAMHRLQHALVSLREPFGELPLPDEGGPHVIRPGRGEGRLLGGNLSLVCALIGTRWELDTTDSIVFLEETGEAPYRVDRMLTQLRSSGAFDRAAGVVLGDFHLDDQEHGSLDPRMLHVFRDRLAELGCPVAFGFPFGHLPRSWTLPFGVHARLDARDPSARARLTLTEAAVR